jgi:hypothetical protein
MENRARKLTGSSESKADTFDLDTLLHPASAFAHPMNVVRDAGLTLNEKRAILASWASDACAVEAAPDLRANASGCAVRWDEIMDALRILDGGEVWLARKRAGVLGPACWRLAQPERSRPTLTLVSRGR